MSVLIYLATFDGPNGSAPVGNIVEDNSNNLFGVTSAGGANGSGVIYELRANGSGYDGISVLYNFDQIIGAKPTQGLVLDSVGDIFGITSTGGANGKGTIFELKNNTTDYSPPFVVCDLSEGPASNILIDRYSNIFYAVGGKVFEMQRSVSGYSTPVNVTNIAGEGESEIGAISLTLGSDGNIYGLYTYTTLGGNYKNPPQRIFEIVDSASIVSQGSNVVQNFEFSLFGRILAYQYNTFFGIGWNQGILQSYPANIYSPYSLGVDAATFDTYGNLIDFNNNVVYEFSYSSGSLHGPYAFPTTSYPNSPQPYPISLLADSKGNVFGIIKDLGYDNGTIFEVVGATAPTISINFPFLLNPYTPINSTKISLSGTINKMDVNDTISFYDGTNLIGTVTAALDGTWKSDVYITNVQGLHKITAMATNGFGEVGISNSGTYYFDSIAPQLFITRYSPIDGKNAITVSGTIGIEDASLPISIWDGTMFLGTTTANSSGEWVYNVILPTFVSHSLIAQATDATKNVGTSNVVTKLSDILSFKSSLGNHFLNSVASSPIWENTSTGDAYEWLMIGNQHYSNVYLGNLSGWADIGSGNFFGSGVDGMLWENQGNGDVYEWQFADGKHVGADIYLGSLAGYNCIAVGAFSDVNGSDIIWQNEQNGEVYEWSISSGLHSGSDIDLGNLSGWSVIGTTKLGGGKSGIIWSNNSSGAVYEWTMASGRPISSVYLGNLTGYSLIGGGDFNGDGVTDLLWKSTSNGDLWEWEADKSGANAKSSYLGDLTGYDLAAVGSFDGAKTDGIIWQGASRGDSWLWKMSSGAHAGDIYLGSTPGWAAI